MTHHGMPQKVTTLLWQSNFITHVARGCWGGSGLYIRSALCFIDEFFSALLSLCSLQFSQFSDWRDAVRPMCNNGDMTCIIMDITVNTCLYFLQIWILISSTPTHMPLLIHIYEPFCWLIFCIMVLFAPYYYFFIELAILNNASAAQQSSAQFFCFLNLIILCCSTWIVFCKQPMSEIQLQQIQNMKADWWYQMIWHSLLQCPSSPVLYFPLVEAVAVLHVQEDL